MAHVDDFVADLADRFPAFQPSVAAALTEGGDTARDLANRIVGLLGPLFGGTAALSESYARMCSELMKSQLKYEMSGRYEAQHFESVDTSVYQDTDRMQTYMLGLACSQFAWRHHFEIWQFYTDEFLPLLGNSGRALEIAPGHGLFGLTLVGEKPAIRLTGVDIAPASVEISRRIAETEGGLNTVYRVANALDLPADFQSAFDVVLCGELLEHLSAPRDLVQNIAQTLVPGGHAFITAALTAGAPDHIHEFVADDEVLDLVRAAGLHIIKTRCGAGQAMTDRAKGPPRTLAVIARSGPSA